MLPLKLYLRQVGPFKDEIVDFSSISGDVIAIVGENGSGKSFLVDSCYAALYRSFPSRDSIYKYCQGKDARIEFEFIIGSDKYKSVINIDAIKRSMEPWLFKDNVAITDGKNSAFDTEILKISGPGRMILTSAFSAQNHRGSFLELSKVDRKGLFIEMLGLGKLQKISDLASVHEDVIVKMYEREFESIESLKKMAANKQDSIPIRETITLIKRDIADEENAIRGIESEMADLKAKLSMSNSLEEQMRTVKGRNRSAEIDLVETTRALEDARTLSSEVNFLRKQVEAYEDLVDQLAKVRVQQGKLQVQQLDYSKASSEYTGKVLEIEKKLSKSRTSIKTSEQQLKRTQSDAGIIDSVPCHAEGECADCQFLVNAIEARDTMNDLVVSIDNHKAEILALEDQMKALIKPDILLNAQVEQQLSGTKRSVLALEMEIQKSNKAGERLARAEAAQNNVNTLEFRTNKIRNDMVAIQTEMVTISLQIDSLESIKTQFNDADKKGASILSSIDINKDHLNQEIVKLSRVEIANDEAEGAQKTIDAALPNLIKLDSDRKSYKLLAKAFGKTGIQSLEIDAAGPAISSIANDLLFSCFGPRFSIRFCTQVVKEDRSGFKDEFDIFVTDSKSEREGSIDDLSGGERVIVSEAVSLAIALFNRSRSHIGWMSLWRDEASSAIDDEKAPLYIKMLRRAREQGMLSKLFFIAHQNRVVENADAKLIVSGGHVTRE